MADWTDLVADATNGPFIDWDANVVEGRDWRFEWPVTAAILDHDGAPFDFSLVSNANAVVAVTDNLENVVISDAAWTWAGAANGTFALTCSRTLNADTADTIGTYGLGRTYRWKVKLILPGTLHIDFIGGEFHINQDGGVA